MQASCPLGRNKKSALYQAPPRSSSGSQETDSSLPPFRSTSLSQSSSSVVCQRHITAGLAASGCAGGFPWLRSRNDFHAWNARMAQGFTQRSDWRAWLLVATSNCFSTHLVISVIVIHDSWAADDLETWPRKSFGPGTNLGKHRALLFTCSQQTLSSEHFLTPRCIDCHHWNVARLDMRFNLTFFSFSFFLEQRQS